MNEIAGSDREMHSAAAFLARGEAAAERGSWVEAKAFFEKARELDPADWKPIQCLGVANFWLDRREEAWSLLVEALRRAPDDPDNATNLLDVARSLGREPEARELLANLGRNPQPQEAVSPAETLCLQGEGLLEAELWSQAIHPFLQAIDRDPERSRAWSGLGISCFRDGLKQAGTVFFEMAMRLDPADEDAVLNWAESCGKDRDQVRDILSAAGVSPGLAAKALEALG
jgi:Flp pilus assembly protein TadD